MLFVGDPETKGLKEDATSCVKMALDMLKELDDLSDKWVDYGMKEPLQMRIGIDTGFATVGNFGSESRLDYTAIGSAVNRASRLETAADHGSIFISEDTYNLVRESIDAIELEPIHLKGIGEFKARKVVGTIDSASISVNLGKRNLSLVLDRLSETELEMTKKSLQQALRELDSFSKP
jgi:class 3 adenylate cyclase